ncbi:ubiquitin carboxyl-terminal hydrolase 14 [Drosophila guanche]|uniref:Ubiquitin carboxyl-terminal hydrolase n=1 Tax=Drosophila guanche TaxID=7266 RepID=A0A3B0JMS0_DROGU|nr:ubiquitin carboxyl-terminal hydrolase 14 [Drosophila guanche]SPP81622.1 blast:Ubiquitin carboxyl-terminal hydrolase 14 [Drosophila guanche]
MPSFKVKVKWGRELFTDIDVNTDEEPILFKAQLFALTGVEPERQKVMCKGGILKDDQWNLQLKDGAVVLLMGSRENVPEVPTTPIKFIEDMNEAETATAMRLPAGLTNLGNTCYMNATIQCLKAVPELRTALNNFTSDGSDTLSAAFSISSGMKSVFAQMDKGATVTPIVLLQALHRASPQFAQTGENGTFRQQDANECWSEILKMLQQNLLPIRQEPSTNNAQKTKHGSFIEQFFGGTFEVKMSSEEVPDESATITTENFLQLSCFISMEVKYMQSGLKSKMMEPLVKKSETLGRDARYIRTYLVSRLPAYLTVQFVRFQYKGKEGINAKVLKDIKFPIDFDAFELCTPELQNKLCPMRSKFKELEDKSMELEVSKPHSVKDDEAEKKYEQFWFDDDLGSNNSGYYTLQAVLTHKGRSSSSGHYVAWVRSSNDIWFKFDDDDVTSVSTEEILRLSGGGDWHCAYVLLYGPKRLEKL